MNLLPEEARHCSYEPFKNEFVRPRNTLKRADSIEAEDQRIIQAARSLKHGSAARASSQNRDSLLLAIIKIHFGGDFIGVPYHDKKLPRLPNPQNLISKPLFTRVQQCLIASQILVRGWES
jgi:hypothetical protein